MTSIRWGILAPGKIAASFATALQALPRASLYSVASRSPNRALAFAKRFNVEKVAADYDALINDPAVDAVYIASPHHMHAEQSVACLNAGKAVLCEKPMAVNAAEAEQVFAAARANQAFYMEAVWTRFMPIHQHVRQWLENGQIGTVQMVQASFGFAKEFDPQHRLYNAKLAGGALLDLGIYPITLSQMSFGAKPEEVVAIGHIGKTGVDEQIGLIMRYAQGRMAVLNASITADTSRDGWIFGDAGKVHIPQFWCAESATLIANGKEEKVKIPHRVNGYEGEIEEVHRCLDQRLYQSPILPWSESLEVVKIMDTARAQIGLSYPFEAR